MTGGKDAPSLQARAWWTLQQAAVPARLQCSANDFAERLTLCDLQLAQVQGARLQGFALGMSSRQPQPDFTQQWFLMRFDSFLYLERLVVAAACQRQGVGRALLLQTQQWAQERGLERMCCQVHDRPANRAAQAFVEAMGFAGLESVMLPSRDIVTLYQRSSATAMP
jgi:predicted GNAT superfamily acetyltransferase